jgi:hypothetical protein
MLKLNQVTVSLSIRLQTIKCKLNPTVFKQRGLLFGENHSKLKFSVQEQSNRVELVLGDQNGPIVGSVNVSKGVLTCIGSAFMSAEQLAINNFKIANQSCVRQPDLHLIFLTGNESDCSDQLLTAEINVEIKQFDWFCVEKFKLKDDIGRKR